MPEKVMRDVQGLTFRCATCRHSWSAHGFVGKRGQSARVGIKCAMKGCPCFVALPVERYEFTYQVCAHANTKVESLYTREGGRTLKADMTVCVDCGHVLGRAPAPGV